MTSRGTLPQRKNPLLSEVVDEYTLGDDMVDVNVVGSDIGQGTMIILRVQKTSPRTIVSTHE